MPCPGRSRLSLFAFINSVWAGYYIDDTNTTLTYSSGPKAAWVPYAIGGETLELLLPNGTYQAIDASVCYNHTYRYAACFDTDDCLLTIPFTGSGITVYVNQAGPVGINASITIDNGHAQTNVLNAPPAPAYQIANVSMFDVQQLPSGPHTLKLLIDDFLRSYSGMMFDYAYVNESLVTDAATTTTTSAPTNTAISTTRPSSHTGGSDTGAIVGGVIAAVVLIVAGIAAFLWIRRRRRHAPELIDLHSNGTSSPFSAQTGNTTPLTHTTGTHDPYSAYHPVNNNGPAPSHNTEHSSSVPLVSRRLGSSEARGAPGLLSNSRGILTPFTGTSGSSNSYGGKARLVLSNDTANVAASPPETGNSPLGPRQGASPLLTDEQADFVNSLHQNNVPAAAIAHVVERMLADRQAGIQGWERETRLSRSNTITTAPPSYDLVAERGEID